jgi:hypothetical protein
MLVKGFARYLRSMKLAAACCFVVGCMAPDTSVGGPQPWGTGNCTSDADCPGQVCARDGACYAATQVRAAVVTWTLQGQMANATTCASSQNLQLDFGDTVGRFSFGFAPVPCVEGRFSIDKLPSQYVQAQLGSDTAPGAVHAQIDPSTSTCALDLPY